MPSTDRRATGHSARNGALHRGTETAHWSASVRPLGSGIYEVTLFFGFMEDADVPAALALAGRDGPPLDADDTTYFLGRETLIATSSPGMAAWREHLFVLMARNAVRATGFFRLPPERVIELGVQVEL